MCLAIVGWMHERDGQCKWACLNEPKTWANDDELWNDYTPSGPHREETQIKYAECQIKGPRYTWARGDCQDCEQFKKTGEAAALGCPRQYWD